MKDELRRGDRVRLHPRQGGDVFDMALAGKLATIESVEQDYEGRRHLSVVVDDDPGQELGSLKQPGHRFFFGPEELEVIEQVTVERITPSILIAGIGNIFLGDDAFGVEVARLLSARPLPAGVRVSDFGIRGFDLAYALDGYDVTILVDACPRGGEPGSLYVIEPELDVSEEIPVETHGMNPMNVLRMAKAIGVQLRRILLVGCEPLELGAGEEGKIGLSAQVEAAVNQAADLIESLVKKILEPACA
jgi:hydrogenase maturation protease